MERRATDRQGFTLIELVVSLVMGGVILMAAMSFTVSMWRTVEGDQLREGVYRNGRFVAMSLERDFQFTGVGIGSTPSFGSLAVWSDTIVILSIPFEPQEAPPYDLAPPPGTNNPLAPGGTCGSECLDLSLGDGTFDLKAGELARLQVNDERRLILVQSVGAGDGSSVQLWFSAELELLHYLAGFAGDLRLDRFSTFVQEVAPVIYYVDGEHLMRAERLKVDGTPDGEVLAGGVQSFEVRLIFRDGEEADEANVADTDTTNDFDDIVGVRIVAVLRAEFVDPRLAEGSPFTQEYEWRFAPRNLMYEKNRI